MKLGKGNLPIKVGSLLKIGDYVKTTPECTFPWVERGVVGRIAGRRQGSMGGYWMYETELMEGVSGHPSLSTKGKILAFYRGSLEKITKEEAALWRLKQ